MSDEIYKIYREFLKYNLKLLGFNYYYDYYYHNNGDLTKSALIGEEGILKKYANIK